MKRKRMVFLLIGVAVVVFAIAALNGKKQEKVNIPHEELQTVAYLKVVPLGDLPTDEILPSPFNTMSRDYTSDTLEGWWHYDIPEEYIKTGGYLPDLVQIYTFALCKQEGIDYPMILAMIEVESGYRWDARSSEDAVGYMQVIYRWHKTREEDLTEDTLKNPYVNIRVAISYVKELQERFGSMEKVLTAYHYGVSGAQKYVWGNGEDGCDYSDKVLETRKRIEEQLMERKQEVQQSGY